MSMHDSAPPATYVKHVVIFGHSCDVVTAALASKLVCGAYAPLWLQATALAYEAPEARRRRAGSHHDIRLAVADHGGAIANAVHARSAGRGHCMIGTLEPVPASTARRIVPACLRCGPCLGCSDTNKEGLQRQRIDWRVLDVWPVLMIRAWARPTHLMLTHPAAMLASTDGTKYGLILRSFCSACR